MTGCAVRSYHRPIESGRGAQLPLSAGPVNFTWPIRGNTALTYGSREDGVTVKGILIRAREGELVGAAAEGNVAFVDQNLPGYGKTIIIEHSGEYSSVYARNAEILVKVGQRVRQGEPIAKAGNKGKGGSPQLYFEIRRRSRAEDPLSYLTTKP